MICINQQTGVFCDSFVGNDTGILFASFWGRNTSLQQFLARMEKHASLLVNTDHFFIHGYLL
jgi:hypothetical protein